MTSEEQLKIESTLETLVNQVNYLKQRVDVLSTNLEMERQIRHEQFITAYNAGIH